MNGDEFLPGCADDDPIIMPGGESHTVGEARRDAKLRRRVAVCHFLEARMQLELLRAYETMEAMPPTDVKDLIRMMSGAAVVVGLAAFDKLEGLEQERRRRGAKRRSDGISDAKEERWGETVRAMLQNDVRTLNKTILDELIRQGDAKDPDVYKVNRFIAKARKGLAAT
jgi:hypothetical protein